MQFDLFLFSRFSCAQKEVQGKTPEAIAEDLEEPLENVERICMVIEQCGLDADAIEIFEMAENSILQEGVL